MPAKDDLAATGLERRVVVSPLAHEGLDALNHASLDDPLLLRLLI